MLQLTYVTHIKIIVLYWEILWTVQNIRTRETLHIHCKVGCKI